MSVPEQLAQDPAVAGPLGSLALSMVTPRASTLTLRALRWHRDLTRLGVSMPLSVVHDMGLLLACPNEQLEIGARADGTRLARHAGGALAGDSGLMARYRAMIDEVASSDAARRSRRLEMSDDLVVVLLARLLGSVAERVPPAPYVSGVPLDTSVVESLGRQLADLFEVVDRRFEVRALGEVLSAELYVLTLVDALDLDTLELFGLVGGNAVEGALAQVDLLGVLGSPEANDVVDFSLEILPSVLETRRRPGATSHAAHGYAGLARKGSVDSLVLTEFAWDEVELLRRLADNEVLYYSHEQARDEARRVHHMLIDASASMRGERATFARGMALAAAKKLLLAGEDVDFRFFDSRLYEAHAARAGQLPVAYLLGFKGERGRNPARVFAELASYLDLMAHRDPREPVVHLFTHAALYVPRELVDQVTRRANLAAVFMMPSEGELHLDYLDLLNGHWVVDHATLASKNARADQARRILDDVGPRPADGAPEEASA